MANNCNICRRCVCCVNVLQKEVLKLPGPFDWMESLDEASLPFPSCIDVYKYLEIRSWWVRSTRPTSCISTLWVTVYNRSNRILDILSKIPNLTHIGIASSMMFTGSPLADSGSLASSWIMACCLTSDSFIPGFVQPCLLYVWIGLCTLVASLERGVRYHLQTHAMCCIRSYNHEISTLSDKGLNGLSIGLISITYPSCFIEYHLKNLGR